MNLHAETFKLIKKRPASLELKQIATDLEISYSWVLKFNQNEITNPSYNTLQSLYDYLLKRIK